MAKEAGWTLLEDTREPWPISTLDLVPFLKGDEHYTGGEEMVRRAEELHANLGQRHAEFLLEHQEVIPPEFRDYYLVFPGTVWRARDGRRGVAGLCWRGERWGLRFDWLESGFHGSCRLLCPREPACGG